MWGRLSLHNITHFDVPIHCAFWLSDATFTVESVSLWGLSFRSKNDGVAWIILVCALLLLWGGNVCFSAVSSLGD